MKILTVNAGSSSLKFNCIELPSEKELISGYFEKIGMSGSFYNIKINGSKTKREVDLVNHSEAVNYLREELINNKIVSSLDEIDGVGHRLVHGGDRFKDSVLLTDEVLKECEKFNDLAPLHNPAMLACIDAFRSAMPNTPMVGVFDTSFHQTIKELNYLYSVPYDWYKDFGIRKYGFHGTSHKYITTVMKEKLGRDAVNLIICHIGSGASISAIKDGKCYDTTMGITPLDGLMMGTRSGAIDPSIIEYVCKESGLTVGDITNDLNKKSGLLGVSGYSDCRDVEKLASENDEKAILALNMYNNRIAKYIADYYIELRGEVDAIVFTAGVGENGIEVRKNVINRLNPLGIYLNEEMNNTIASFKDIQEGKISTDDSKVDIFVVPTDEEIMIVKDTFELIK